MKKIQTGDRDERRFLGLKKRKREIMIFNILFMLVFLPLFHETAFASTHEVTQEIKTNKNKVMCVTIPKTGTHLLLKCISLMGIDTIDFEYWKKPHGYHLHDLNEKVPQSLINAFKKDKKKTFTRHLMYTPESHEFIKKNTYANFFMIRDPRAQLVSQAFTFKKARIGGKERSLEDIMLDIILARKENFLPRERHLKYQNLAPNIFVSIADLFWHVGLYQFYKLFTPWMQAEGFYTVHFENLIGAQGGGTQEAQTQEIKNIAQHLGVKLSAKKITEIMSKLFGGTGTFREGNKDSWKQHFTPAVKEAFKANSRLMQMLVDLEYEKDMNW